MKKLRIFVLTFLNFQTMFANDESSSIVVVEQEMVSYQGLDSYPSSSDFSSSLEELNKPAIIEISDKSPEIAALFSTAVPGLGHLYLKDYWKAGEFMGTLGSQILLSQNKKISKEADSFLSSTTLCTWGYGIYAAYRDARIMRSDRGYHYAMPKDDIKDLILAPFRPSILKKPEVWGGLLGSLSLAFGITYLSNTLSKQKLNVALSVNSSFVPLTAFPVGIWEEAFFRGYLQSSVSEWATPIGGVAISSMFFGAAHIPNFSDLEDNDRKIHYMTSLPFITLAGAYMGWMTQKNQSLQESVALHAWYDFTLFSLGLLAEKAAIGSSSVSVEFSF